MRTPRRLKAPAVLAFAAAALAGCEKTNALDLNLVTISNLQDAFTFSVNGLDNVSDAERYYMTTTGPQVIVEVTEAISSGIALLQIRDGAGDIVYQEDLADDIDELITSSITGFWQIDLVLTEVTGAFDFRIYRDTPSVP